MQLRQLTYLAKVEFYKNYKCAYNTLQIICFYVVSAVLFGFTMAPEQIIKVGPAWLWFTMSFSLILAITDFFAEEYASGVLARYLLLKDDIYFVILIKAIVTTATILLPLLISLVVISQAFCLTNAVVYSIIVAMLLTGPVVLLLGMMVASLVYNLKNNNVLMIGLLLPLLVPVLLLGLASVDAVQNNVSNTALLAILAAIFTVVISFSPFAIAYFLRINYRA